MGYLVYSQAQSPLCHRPGEDDWTRTRNGLDHNQAPQPFGSSSVRNQGLEPRTNCVWSSRSAAELIAHNRSVIHNVVDPQPLFSPWANDNADPEPLLEQLQRVSVAVARS